jgi:hypothetical protein
MLLFLGTWAATAGHLPHENPYYRERRHDGTEVPLPANFTDPGKQPPLRGPRPSVH